MELKTCPTCGYTGENFSAKVPECRPCKKERNKRDNELYVKGKRHIAYSKNYRVPKTIVYGFKEGDEFAYIGSTDNGSYRLWEHYNSQHKTFCRELSPLVRQLKYEWHVLWHGDNYEDAKHQEKMMLQIHKPKCNKILYKNYEG